MDKKFKSLDEIFEDDDMGLLHSKPQTSNFKTEDQRLIESFEEINDFYEKHKREPESSGISEFRLSSRLKNLRDSSEKIEILQEFDRFNLLKADKKVESIDDIFNDDIGLLDTGDTLSIFDLKHVPSPSERAEADFVAQRKPMNKGAFEPYEAIFKEVHAQLKSEDLKLIPFQYEILKPGEFYVHNGVLLYLENVEWDRDKQKFNSGEITRPDGRTRTIFENGTISNMMFQSLYKSLHFNGKAVTQPASAAEDELFKNAQIIDEDDMETGWIYILKSKSTHPEIAGIKNLYKIGYSSQPVAERIKNATKQSTYLHADVQVVATYKCYNINPQKFESLLHRFLADVCLNVDIHDSAGRRITPREWFVAPFNIIEEVIQLILSERIIQFEYNPVLQVIQRKKLK